MKTEFFVLLGFVLLVSAAFLMSFDPIEKVKQAKDQALKEDAILVLGAIEDYFKAKSRLPWFDDFASNNPSPALPWTPLSSPEVGVCSTKGCKAGGGDLIKENLLSYGFNDRESVKEGRLLVGKGEGAKDPVWACFVPLADEARKNTSSLYRVDLKSPVSKNNPSFCSEDVRWEEEVCYMCISQ